MADNRKDRELTRLLSALSFLLSASVPQWMCNGLLQPSLVLGQQGWCNAGICLGGCTDRMSSRPYLAAAISTAASLTLPVKLKQRGLRQRLVNLLNPRLQRLQVVQPRLVLFSVPQ